MTANNLVNLKLPKRTRKNRQKVGFPPRDKGKRKAVKRRRKTRGWLCGYWNKFYKSLLFKIFLSQRKRQKNPHLLKKTACFFLAYLDSNDGLFN